MFYVAIDEKLVAYHNNKRIANKYAKSYSKYHPESTCLLLKDSSKSNSTKIDSGNELIQVGKIYLQRKYEDAYNAFGRNEDVSSISHSIEILERELLHENDYQRMLEINEGINILKKHRHDESHYVPSIREMDNLCQTLMEWQYSVYH